MALTLVLGPANSAKAGEVFGAFTAAAARGALLVVPTAQDARHYARELAGEGAVLGTVTTFAGLIDVIGRRTGAPARALSEVGRRRVLERVCEQARLEVLAPSAVGAGFVTALGDLVAELQRALVRPERLISSLRRWAAQDVRRAPYAAELGRLYGGYRRELERIGFLDGELRAWRALDALRAHPDRWGSDAVLFYGFDDLTPLERDAVEALARVAGAAVSVSLTYEPGRAALSARAETVQELRPLAERVLELPPDDEHYAAGSRATLHHIERGLFGADDREQAGRTVHAGEAVTLLEAGGERAEAELVAERILALRRLGVHARDIVVVHRSLAHAAPLLRRVLRGYGIAVTGGPGPGFGQTPLGRALLAGARCALMPASATAGNLLGYLRFPGLLSRPEDADRVEAEVRRRALRSAAQARAVLDQPLPELDELAAAADASAGLCRLARRMFAAGRRGTAPLLDGPAALDALALRTLAGAVQELSELAPAIPPPEDEALLAIVEGLRVPAPAPPDSATADEVLLAEPLEIRARRFRAVFVCGLQEGVFPRPPRPEPFLDDNRRFELAAASGLRLRAHEDSLPAERYLFYAALSRATEWVFLSYCSSDEEGNLALASPFIEDVAALLKPGWREQRERRLLADVVWPADRAPTAREIQRAAAAATASRAGEVPVPVRTLGPAALGRVRHSQILSPGALESYGDCGVRWLIEKELAPQPLAPDPEPLARGSLIHRILEELLSELGGPVTPASLDWAQEILGRRLAETARKGAADLAPAGSEIVRAAVLRGIEADLRRYLSHEASTGPGWSLRGVEMRFGFDEEAGEGASLPALSLGEGEDTVRVRGVIDRVDADAGGQAIVRDYKSGAQDARWPAARWSSERRLQVALYMLVVRELTELDPVGGFYQPLRGRDLRARGVFVEETDAGGGAVTTDARSPGELDALLDDAAQRAVVLGAALRHGRLEPCPQTCSRDGCRYPAICRSG